MTRSPYTPLEAPNLRVGPHERRVARTIGLVTGIGALLLYVGTCSPGVEWQDSGVHQYRIVTGRLESTYGLALSHPLHYYLGRVALAVPLGDALRKLNLLSCLGGALAVGLLAGVVFRITISRCAALLAAATLAVAHSFWQMAALTETYTLAAGLMTLEWAMLLRYLRRGHPLWLMAVFAVNGLHVADHLLGLLTLATYGVLLLALVLRRRLAPVWLAIAGAAWLVGAAPYVALVVGHFLRTGDLANTLQSALFGLGPDGHTYSGQVLNVSLSLAHLKLVVLTFGYCFPSAAGLIALVGVLARARGWRQTFRRVLLAQTIIIFMFVGRYTVADLYTFFVPVCVLTAWWVGVGTARLLHRWHVPARRVWPLALLGLNALLPLVVYSVFPGVAAQRGWLRADMRDLPHRDEYAAFLKPWRHGDDSAQRFAQDVLSAVDAGDWIVADSTTAPAIALVALRADRTDVRVFSIRWCLVPPGDPPLTDEALLAHVAGGGRVLVVPSSYIQSVIPLPLTVAEDEPFWWVQPPPLE